MSESQPVSVLDLPSHALTPGMRQYQEVKRQHPDCLVMLRMGDFYEMFYQDAITAAKELEITLTSRGMGEKKAPLAGVPFHALETYLGKLVKKGYKVAIVEQLEDPKFAKGLVKRGLARIVTPGTVMESSLLEEKENNYIVALTSSMEGYTLAASDISTGEFFVTPAGSLHQLATHLAQLQPRECILPASLQIDEELLHLLRKNELFIQIREDYFFQEERAKNLLLQHFQIPSLESFGIEEKQQIKTSGALLQYLLETQKNALSHLRFLRVKSNHHHLLLDAVTLRNLELLKNAKDGSLRGTLLSVLDKTLTPLGARLLKKWITEPLCDIPAITQRLDALQFLQQQLLLREELRDALKEIADIERLLSRINYGNATPKDVLALKYSLRQIPVLKSAFSRIKEKVLSENSREEKASSGEHFFPLMLLPMAEMSFPADIFQEIESAVRDDAPLFLREGGIIRKGYHSELDALLHISINSKKFLQELEEKERQKTGISTLKIGYTSVFGYFIEVTKKNVHLVPSTYIRKQTTANGERYITEELKIEEEKILTAQEKILALEYELFQKLLKKIALQTEEFQIMAQKISVLDVLCSLAMVASEQGYVRPEFVDAPVLQIAQGRHPVLEKMESRFIANDVFLASGEMMIITGPNMSGKSTIMRQTALIVLLAQMGCFVPAEKAVLGLADRIFTRIGASDDLSAGQSTFMAEMQETASILHNATERSLIILDEIGRGTSTFDGVSLAWSVAEHIHTTIKAKTLFATHYHVLNKLAENLPRIKNYNVAAKEIEGEVVLLHKLVPGGTDQSFGIHVAKLAGLPKEVVERAQELQEALVKDDEMVRRLKVKKLEEQKSLQGF